RRMLLVRLRAPGGEEVVVANVHLSTAHPHDEALAAAEHAVAWSEGTPLVFGGDLNARPEQAPRLFAELERRHALVGPTAPDGIDYLLTRGLARRGYPSSLANSASVVIRGQRRE